MMSNFWTPFWPLRLCAFPPFTKAEPVLLTLCAPKSPADPLGFTVLTLLTPGSGRRQRRGTGAKGGTRFSGIALRRRRKKGKIRTFSKKILTRVSCPQTDSVRG